jgi:homocysteine S-methyltransferase
LRPTFLDAIAARVLVCDGAMGTMLYARGVFVNRSFDALNLTSPDLVSEVHREYLRAGADVVETNTFGANRIKLGSFGLADKLHEINLAGARIARQVARDGAYVAGAIGPLSVRIEPWGRMGVDEAEACFREQAAALVEGGVDLIVLETFRDVNEIGAAIAAIRKTCDLPIVAQMTTEEDGNSLDGTPPEEFVPALERAGASVIGVNCSVGPAPMLETIERIARVSRNPLAAQPNAGRPREIEGRNIYLSSPEYLASYARRFVQHGVRLVGGCCGTTPEHIRQIRQVVRSLELPPPVRTVVSQTAAAPPAAPVPRAEKSRLSRALSENRRGVGQRRSAGRRAHERALAGPPRAAGGRHRAGAAVRLPRSLSALDAVGSARGARRRHQERRALHRRSQEAGRLLGRDARVRCRFDRTDQRGVSPEPRARHRRPAHRGADRVPHRRRRQPDCAAAG